MSAYPTCFSISVAPTTMESGNLVINWNGFQGNLNSQLDLLRQDFTDVTLVCQDEEISAHKIILSASSEFFRGIFRRNPREYPLIYLKGIKMSHLQSMLNFIYTGEAEVAEKDLSELLEAAFDLKIKGLSDRTIDKESKPDKDKIHEVNEKRKKNNSTLDTIDDDLEEMFALKDYKTAQIKENDTTEMDHQIERLMVSSFDAFTGKTIWKCLQCDYSPKVKNSLREHVETHIAGISHLCSFCNKTFGTRNSLRVHKIRTHDHKSFNLEQEFKADIREKKYDRVDEQRKMNLTLDTIEDDLEEMFALDDSKTVEMRDQIKVSIEPAINISSTNIQEYNDTTEIDLQIERLMVSSFDAMVSSFDAFSGKTIWKCVQCDYSPKVKHTLKEHVETHIEGISHLCSVCDKSFSTRNSLRVHKIRSHTNK